MTDRATSFEHLLRLAHQRALDGKGGLAASVAKLCLDSRADLSARELALTYEILRMLIDKVEMEVRRNISDYLCTRTDVPRDLIAFLANDKVHVAYPILRHSSLLNDEDLIKLVRDHGHGHAMAVATRPELSEKVSHFLVSLKDDTVDTSLAKNFAARIAQPDMAILVDRSIDQPALHAPLSQRSDLGAELARKLFTIVGDTLRRHIVENYDIDNLAVADAVDAAILNALDDPDPLGKVLDGSRSKPTPSGGWAEQAKRGADKPPVVVMARLVSSGRESAAVAYAEATHLPLPTARWIFTRADTQTLAIALKAIGTDSSSYITAAMKLGLFKDEAEVDRATSYFDRIDAKTAAMVVNHWKTRPPIDEQA
ncbi:DUF2336 domain-containing protein [Rhodospirillaceae bacterium KN72]|uniref:DUF2336 domain-containing protein n=1 Tax=Pacificispira spongiicola TaxID=2729598 RepID=A0A7Y0DZ44_9PROT|nr:DUF2336 domain-containing protein [Pacificispira spongiicola]NMM44148.1 DUF2336 domain-containing protein [Pacificispira spongiicola]